MLSLKGVPTPEIMEKVDKVKKMLIDDINHPWRFILWEKWYRRFWSKAICCPIDGVDSAKEIGIFIRNLTNKESLGLIAYFVVGSDMAYRLRIQDMLNEIIIDEKTLSNPRKELKRLWKIYERRESVIPTYMLPKSRRVFNLIYYALFVPSVKKRFVGALRSMNQNRIKFTDEDKEWIKHRVDYKFYA